MLVFLAEVSMFCSGCGQALGPGQAFCAACGRPAVGVIPPVPGFEFQLENYAGKVKTLSILWYVYAGLTLILGFAAISFLHAFFNGALGNLMHGPPPPAWLAPLILRFAIPAILLRSALAFAAGWGLMDRSSWGRIMAIVAAILSLLKFPFGTALGIWTLVMLLGYRNARLYEQL
jgi:hypothetical protein